MNFGFKFFSLLLFQLITITSIGQVFGGDKNDHGASFCEIDNGFFVLGTTRSLGAGSDDFWELQLLSNKDIVFNYQYGWITHDVASKTISTYNNHIISTGYSWSAPGPGFRGDVVIRKKDVFGNLVWTSYYGEGTNEYPSDIIETSDHGYLLTGVNEASANTGAVYLLKLNEDGTTAWSKKYESSNKDMGMSLVECPDSTFMILANTGTFHSKVANSSEYLNNQPTQIMLIKVGKTGDELWRKILPGDDYNFGNQIVERNNSFYVIGSGRDNSMGSFDINVYKIDQAGAIIWKKNYGGTDYDYGKSIDINENGDLALAGYSSSNDPSKDADIYFACLDSNGVKKWENYIDNGWSDYGEQVRFLNDGNLALVGSVEFDRVVPNNFDLFFQTYNSFGDEIDLLTDSQEIDPALFFVYPNPVKSQFYIEISEEWLGEATLELQDMNGKIIHSEELILEKQLIHLNHSFTKGVYTYRIILDSVVRTGKIIIN